MAFLAGNDDIPGAVLRIEHGETLVVRRFLGRLRTPDCRLSSQLRTNFLSFQPATAILKPSVCTIADKAVASVRAVRACNLSINIAS